MRLASSMLHGSRIGSRALRISPPCVPGICKPSRNATWKRTGSFMTSRQPLKLRRHRVAVRARSVTMRTNELAQVDGKPKDQDQRTSINDRLSFDDPAVKWILSQQEHVDKIHCGPPPQERELHVEDPEWHYHQLPTDVDPRDKDTPDNWVKRNPNLTRLTGPHPMNGEPPSEQLTGAGFITPVSLHYVRSHGKVPKLDWSSHRLTVSGMVDRPLVLTMDMLMALPQHSVVATMACARLRRKEVNMLGTRTSGYDAGPCSISTAKWTGVLLSDVLELAGAHGGKEGARWVLVSGPENEVPAGDKRYETSLPIHQALDPGAEVILAYKQNDRLLQPDHGFPVRLLAPGHIGGRSVKWLSSIVVSHENSTNHYHQHDNRIFPSHVRSWEQAQEEGLLTNPDYEAREQNIQSIISHPAHDQVVAISGDEKQTIKFSGYAVSGGGRRIRDVELTIDGGESWQQAKMLEAPAPSEYGLSWAWNIWEVEMPVKDLVRTGEVRVRAWDNSQNTQPLSPTWNLLGMMNNCQYAVHLHTLDMDDGRKALRVEHPVALSFGPSAAPGWMELPPEKRKVKNAAGVMAGSLRGTNRGWQQDREQPVQYDKSLAAEMEEEEKLGKAWNKLPEIDEEELKKHTDPDKGGVWFVRYGKVYDPTEFLDEHPGGREVIIGQGGKNAEQAFNPVHGEAERRMACKYVIGRVKGAPDPYAEIRQALSESSGKPPREAQADGTAEDEQDKQHGQQQQAEGPPAALQKGQACQFKLVEKVSISHDTRRFRFELPTPQHRLGLPVGHHITLNATINGQKVVRPYTPVTLDKDLGHFDLVIKIYDQGKMTQHLEHDVNPGDCMEVWGPLGQLTLHGKGKYTNHGKECTLARANMIAGGTGITPMYQVLQALLEDPEDKTQFKLIYANKTPDDILIKNLLDGLADKYPDRFEVFYTVDKDAPSDWKYGTGRVTQDMIQKHGFEHSPDTVAFVCGPPGLVEKACKPALKNLGFEEDHILEFA